MQDLAGKVVVITGGARGIGRAYGEAFAAAGAHIVLADVEPTSLRDAVAEFAVHGEAPFAQVCDVADADDVASLRDAVLERHGAVHVVCLNAGVAGAGGLQWEVPLADWAWTFGVNVWGVVHGVHAFVPLLVDQDEGHIVITASMAGLVAPPLMGPYTASKHAVVGMAESLRHDLTVRGSNVGATVVCPGWVRTGIMDADRLRSDGIEDAAADASVEAAAADASVDDAATIDAFRDAGRRLVAAGIEPGEVAAAVLDAVRRNDFWVLTHPEMATAALKRVEDAIGGRGATVGRLE